MTATERLRELLDERGVKWKDENGATKWLHGESQWSECRYDPMAPNFAALVMLDVAPEQAIAATLGSCNCSDNCTNSERTETCHMEQTGHVKVAGVDYYDDDYECSECGAEIFEGYNFCPNCGRRIEVDA